MPPKPKKSGINRSKHKNGTNMAKKPKKSLKTNQTIAKLLRELARNERNVNKDQYRADAYRRAATTLANLSEPVQSGADSRQLEGIGESIEAKIDEFFRTGKIKAVENVRASETNRPINELASVLGIGPKKAEQFANRGIKTLADLKKVKLSIVNDSIHNNNNDKLYPSSSSIRMS